MLIFRQLRVARGLAGGQAPVACDSRNFFSNFFDLEFAALKNAM